MEETNPNPETLNVNLKEFRQHGKAAMTMVWVLIPSDIQLNSKMIFEISTLSNMCTFEHIRFCSRNLV